MNAIAQAAYTEHLQLLKGCKERNIVIFLRNQWQGFFLQAKGQ